MVLPPNRIGAIRGPNGATLDDVVALLGDLTATNANIALTLSTLQGDVAQLASDTRALVGNPASFPVAWDGVVPYLLATLGALSPSRSIAEELQDMRALLLAIAISQGTGNAPPYANNSLPFLNISEIFRVLSTQVGDTIFNRVGNLSDNSTALLQAVGTFNGSPANETVKTLLDALVTCCEGPPVVPEPPPLNPLPSTACNDFEIGPSRVTGYAGPNPALFPGSVDFDFYVLLFDNISADTTAFVNRDFDTNGNGITYPALIPSTGLGFCLSWDFTGGNIPALISIYRAGTDDWFTSSPTGSTIPSVTTPIGSFVDSLSSGVRHFVQIQMNKGDAPPGLNFWLKYTEFA